MDSRGGFRGHIVFLEQYAEQIIMTMGVGEGTYGTYAYVPDVGLRIRAG